jgi:hypothetical protein
MCFVFHSEVPYECFNGGQRMNVSWFVTRTHNHSIQLIAQDFLIILIYQKLYGLCLILCVAQVMEGHLVIAFDLINMSFH